MDTTQIVITSVEKLSQIDSTLINTRVNNIMNENHTIYLIGKLGDSSSFFKDNILSIISIVIAVLAFYVSWRVLSITRKHNKLSLKPHLIFRVDTNHKNGTAKLYMINKGLGPCIFERFDFCYKSHTEDKMSELFRHILTEFGYTSKDLEKKLYVYPLHNYCILPSEEKVLLSYELSDRSKKDSVEFYKATQEIEFKYKYRDFYDKSKESSFKYSRDLHNENQESEETSTTA